VIRHRRFVHSFALIILLLAGLEIVVCQEWSPVSCRLSQQTSDGDNSPASGDDCFCCCAHLLMAYAPVLTPERLIELAAVRTVVALPLPIPASVYHPPQA
jgi:hypothetical protein